MRDINEAAADTGSVTLMPKRGPLGARAILKFPETARPIQTIAVPTTAMKQSLWPEDSLEAERRFGSPTAKLYPFLGKTVSTPEGSGMLWQAFSSRCGVVLEKDPKRVIFMQPELIRPEGKNQ